MANKFTPGKWEYSHRLIPNDPDGMYATQVYTPDGKTIATLSWYAMPAQREFVDGEPNIVTGTYRDGNARLVSAAPDMLEALSNLENDNNSIPEHAWKLVQDAIRKATGSL